MKYQNFMSRMVILNYTKYRKPKPIGESVSHLLKNLGIDKKVKQHQAITSWPGIVGEKVSNVTEVEKVIDGILFIKVTGSTWRNELIYMKKDLLQRMNNTFGATIIKDIRFK